MTSSPPPTRAGGDLERQALAALRKMRERVDALEAQRHEPLAIVGAACRLPGAPDLERFWDLLSRGGDAIVDIPPQRWDAGALDQAETAAHVPRRAGLLDDIEGFDAEFFGITDREAQLMDPQQRIFLEVAWEALERAGIPPLALKGSRTGVFVGTTTTDYLQLAHQRLSAAEHDAYIVSGNTINATAGRVSYTLGLHGPAMAIDSACSSSLLALDRACRSVRDGESRLAIAGGVNLVLMPQLLLSLARWGMLAPDGRCKTFDAAADGFVRAEGCGVVLIKRLSDALADGDQVWALVHGSAVNQAGASGAFAVPNGLAQADVLRDALAAAQVDPAMVAYVEAHGTGTALGDPLEMEAIASVYGARRPADQALWVGAVKSNVGHLEAAAGVVGLLKTVLALRHRQIPPNVHFKQPSPHIAWHRLPVRVPTQVTPFPAIAGRRLAGVSAFGFSGTNVHMVLEEAPTTASAPVAEPLPALLLTLSARSPQALQTLALRHAERLQRGADATATCLAVGAARSHLSQRIAVAATDASELVERLHAVTQGGAGPGVVRGRVGIDRPAVAFFFTGQGAQYHGMARRLAQSSAVFRDALQRCAALIDPLIGRPLLPLIHEADADAALLDRTGYTQPALFAIEYSLCEWWRSVGVVPTLVVGHSVGEFAASCCAGVLTLEQAATLVTQRAALMQALPAGGAMAALAMPEQQVRERIAAASTLAIAGINGPNETVVSGDAAAVCALVDDCIAAGLRAEMLPVSHAFHSPLMRPMVERFAQVARDVLPALPLPAGLAVVSSLTGQMADARWGSPDYWVQQLQAPVRWFDALRTAAAQGVAIALEIGPHPVLVGLGQRGLPDAPIAWLPSLRRMHDDGATIMATLGELYVRGAVDDWTGRAGAGLRAHVELPPYPFQHARHWIDAPRRPSAAPAQGWLHPLLGAALPLASGDALFQSLAGDARHAFVRQHRFGTACVWPAAASIEMLLAAARELGLRDVISLCELEFPSALLVPDDGIAVQALLQRDAGGAWAATIGRAPQQPGERSSPFALARVRSGAMVPVTGGAELPMGDRQSFDPSDLYQALHAAGAEFGPAFRRLADVVRSPGEAIGRIEADGLDLAGWHLHPALLDGALQLVSVAAGWPASKAEHPWVPVRCAAFTLHGAVRGTLRGHARLRDGASARLVADLWLHNLDGSPVACIEAAVFTRMPLGDLSGADTGLVERCAFEIGWIPVATAGSAAAPSRWHLIGSDTLCSGLADALRAADCQVSHADVESDAGSAHVVHMAALDLPAAADADTAFALLQPVIESVLRVAQACAHRTGPAAPRLWLVTRHAQAVRGHEAAAPLAAALWGLARVLRCEHPELRCTVLDADASCDGATLARALRNADARESQLALRDQQLYAARVQALPRARPLQLLPPSSGRLDELAWTPMIERAPGPGEVRIAVQAAGLNFRDVLRALGMVEGLAAGLGGECAGVVSAVGSGVADLHVGDEVLALAFGGLASSVCVPRQFVVQRPAQVGPVDGAALPIACLTASYALEELAGVRRGDRVLIHAATGGVGLAALQLARHLGAEVFATAGSDIKRARLQALGVRHVFDSRTLAFREQILALTAGAGVQLVLNALAGDFIAAGLSLVARGGCFLEMGKRGTWSAAAVAAQFPGIRYHVFDLGEAALRDAELAPRLFARLNARLAAGDLAPLPVARHPMRDAQTAFHTMAQARHIGKLVLYRDPTLPALPRALRADGSYLVTGAFGALGLQVAEALVARGARQLVLLGRHAPSAAAQARIADLEARGAVVQRAVQDIADGAELRALLTRTARSIAPLRGAIHAAGVLDDAVLARQDWGRFSTVLRPKLLGALNLAAATASAPLDFLVFFSAGAGWLGPAGQANYAAANAAVDALAQTLRAQGRPATTIAWGRWAGAGMASATGSGDGVDWAAQGVGAIEPHDGVAAMFELIERQAAAVAVLPMDWAVHLARAHGGHAPACFDALLQTAPSKMQDANALACLQALLPHERRAALQQQLDATIRRIAGLPAARTIDPTWPLRELGIDSLMSVELRNALSSAFGRTLSATLVFDHPTLHALTEHLLATLPGLADSGDTDARPLRDRQAEAVGALSDEQAEAELLVELARGSTP
jgi:acyl transferase domain-containing protein/NAD(P)-dependent dehydrogenase (short-subunit alcohol dehydrogenase family)/acyl carrier protein